MIAATLTSIRERLLVLRSSALARDAGSMLIGQGLSVLFQAGYLILLARLLGVTEYGIFVGAFSFSAIATPFCALGSGMLFMRYAHAESNDVAAYWGNVLLSTMGMGAALSAVLLLVAPHLLNAASASIILPVAVGNCICTQLLSCMGQMFQAFEQLRITALMNLSVNFLRLVAVVGIFVTLRRADATVWATIFLAVSVVAVLGGAIVATRRFGRPKFDLQLFRSRALEGFGFSLAGSTQSIYNDVDKTMMSHYGMNAQNGLYTMAYRIVDVASLPIAALDSAALPLFFRRSRQGIKSLVPLAIRLATRASLLGVGVALSLFIAAPLVPRLLGSGFTGSVLALRWLCLLPVFRGVHQLTGSAITGMGFQRFRTIVQFCAAAFNLGLNLWLIPSHGWIGAAWASLVTDGAMAVANFTVLCCLRCAQPGPDSEFPVVTIKG